MTSLLQRIRNKLVREIIVPVFNFIPAMLRWEWTRETEHGQEDDSPDLRSAFSEFVGSTETLLDVGCGKRSLYHAKRIVGIDPIPNPEYPYDFVLAVGEHLPFRDGAFDVCTCFTSLDHTFDPAKVISEMRRVSRRVGIASTVTSVKGLIHPSRLNREMLLSLVRPTEFRVLPLTPASEFIMLKEEGLGRDDSQK